MKQPAPKRTKAPIEHLPAISLAALTAMTVIAHLVPFDTAAAEWKNVAAIMLWLLLFLGWALAGVLRGEAKIVFDRTTILVLVLTLLPGVSAIAVGLTLSGNARLAINLGWQWAAFGLLFLLARQWLKTAADARLLAALMISIAVGLSVYALVDFAILKPQLQAEFKADPAKVLQQSNIAPNTPMHKHLADRLNSTEPTATFALTNSLAGLITPWLVLVVGIALSGLPLKTARDQNVNAASKATPSKKMDHPQSAPLSRADGILTFVIFLVSALLLVAVLILTKSRTAYLATLGGIGLAVLYATPLGRRIDARILLAIGLVAIGGVIGGIVSGALDVEVLSEAPKSVLYRLQYWQATSQMIRDHAVLGVGPGNFQEYYKHYQLPEASENIADPHNFVLEIWSSAGTPAVFVLALLALIFAMQLRRRPKEEAEPPPADQLTAPLGAHAIGALVGVLLGYACGFLADLMPSTALLYTAIPAAALTLWLLQPWIERGELRLSLLLAALVALLVNLLAAGGISFPGVATSIWLLVAMALVTARPPRERGLSRSASIGWLAAAAGAGTLFYFSVYSPVLVAESLGAEMVIAFQSGQMSEATALAQRATEIDTLSPDPWLHLANLRFERLMGEDTPKTRGDLQTACEETIQRDPQSERTRTIFGDWYLRLWRHHGDEQNLSDLGTAAEHYQNAARLYPNNAMVHAQLAWVLHLLGRDEEAAAEAGVALDLDSRHDHAEYKLKSEYNPGVFDPGPSPGKRQPPFPDEFRKEADRLTTEPLMQWLRKK